MSVLSPAGDPATAAAAALSAATQISYEQFLANSAARARSPSSSLPPPSSLPRPLPTTSPLVCASASESPDQDHKRLILTIQRQTETLDKLHAALREHKEKAATLQRENHVLQSEATAAQTLKAENRELKRELQQLQNVVQEFQRRHDGAHASEQASIELRAALQSELKASEEEVAKLKGEVVRLQGVVQERDSKVAELMDKLSSGNESDIKAQIEQMKERASGLQQELRQRVEQCRAVNGQMEQLKAKVASANDDLAHKDDIIAALEQENKAYKKNISSLIAQIHGRGRQGHRSLTPTQSTRGCNPFTTPVSAPSVERGDIRKIYDPLFAEATADSHRGFKYPLQSASPPHISPPRPARQPSSDVLMKLQNYRQSRSRQA